MKNYSHWGIANTLCSNYGLETVVSVLLTNTRTRWPHNEREIFNTARGVAECSIENFEASKCVYLSTKHERTDSNPFNIQSEYAASDHRLNELQTISLMFKNKKCGST